MIYRKEYWRPVRGYECRYRVSSNGVIRAIGMYKGLRANNQIMAQSWKHNVHGSDYMVICLKDAMTGKRKQMKVAVIVWEAFNGPVPEGYAVIHANGMKSDNSLKNLRIITKKELGHRYGGMSNRRGIVKIDASGAIVDAYSTSREAAKKNFCSYQTILDRCNGHLRNPDKLFGGATFAWADGKGRR